MKFIVNSCMICKISVESCGFESLATQSRNISNLLTPIVHCKFVHDIGNLNRIYQHEVHCKFMHDM